MPNVNEYRDALRSRLEAQGIRDAEVSAVEDPFGGWRLLVVSTAFEGKTGAARRSIVFGDIEYDDLEWFDIVTPDEHDPEVARRILEQVDVLPLWPIRLALKPDSVPEAILPSDLDEPLPTPFVVTFFSLRGGVGRSTALASAAHILSQRGHRVVCVDMDLEAPGLAALFGLEEAVQPAQGTLSLLIELEAADTVDVPRHLLRVSDERELYCMPAGLPSAEYARKLSRVDAQAWYEEERNPLRLLMDAIGHSRIAPEAILLDARTGISPLNAPLLFDLSDLVVIVFFPHPQSLRGTEALTRALLTATTRRKGAQFTPEPRFVIAPVPPSRIPGQADFWEQRGKDAIGTWILPLNQARKGKRQQLDVEEITHVIPYQEGIANTETVPADVQSRPLFEPIANWIEDFIPSELPPKTPAQAVAKSEILTSLEFATGIAEAQQAEEFLSTFLRTDVVSRAMDSQVPLILGRKGTGKSAIFRILQLTQPFTIAIGLAPSGAGGPAWLPDSGAFAAIDTTINETGESWATVWALLSVFALVSQLARVNAKLFSWPDSNLDINRLLSLQSRRSFIDWLRTTLTSADAALYASEWMDQIDQKADTKTIILIDGLDTEFGQSGKERERRSRSVGGLLQVVDQAQRLQSIGYKVLLRQDIWREVSFPNKSHFFGRDVTLAWDDQFDYLKVALKQALRSQAFRDYASVRLPAAERALLDAKVEIDGWHADASLAVWRLLVGPRLAGGNTAFTHNWVWNRLADGTGGHGPRSLLQLFHLARGREERFHGASPYAASIIRPRALTDSLDEVSEQALTALQEEFSELRPLMDKLRSVGRTPLPVEDFGSERDLGLEKLAIEVGLLSAASIDPGEIERYRVPELYRRALNMTRRGQV